MKIITVIFLLFLAGCSSQVIYPSLDDYGSDVAATAATENVAIAKDTQDYRHTLKPHFLYKDRYVIEDRNGKTVASTSRSLTGTGNTTLRAANGARIGTIKPRRSLTGATSLYRE